MVPWDSAAARDKRRDAEFVERALGPLFRNRAQVLPPAAAVLANECLGVHLIDFPKLGPSH
jgi:hypothetical protein